MRGYPKVVATKQDYVNLLGMEEFKKQALTDLRQLYKVCIETARVKRAISPKNALEQDGEWLTEDIENQNPVWKQKGFKSLDEVRVLLEQHGVKVAEVLNG